MRGNGLPGWLLLGLATLRELVFSVAVLLLILTLYLAGWHRLMDATDELGMDPARTRLYEAGAELPPPDLSAFAPGERLATNRLGMKLALIPAGEFVMGSPLAELGRSPGEVPHRVRISKPFYLGVCEVTVAQFRGFVTETGYRPYKVSYSATGAINSVRPLSLSKPAGTDAFSWENPGFAQRDDHPVVNVSWTDAVEFCRWLTRKENHTYRLPTEAEWEYSCRVGTTQPYNMPTNGAAGPFLANLGRIAHDQYGTQFTWKDGFTHTAPVGSFPPNRLGLCDMHGNVGEYCSDDYELSHYSHPPSCDPQAAESGLKRIIRGGDWSSDLMRARSASRQRCDESTGHPCVGFRVARSYAQE